MPYQRTFLDRLGPDGAFWFRLVGPGLLAFTLVAAVALLLGGGFGFAILAGLVVAAATVIALHLYLRSVGGAVLSFLWPSGDSTPFRRQFSLEDSMIIRGRPEEAARSFERIAAAEPEAVDVRLRLADLYAGEARNPARAAEVFRAVRQLPGITAAEDRYATNRLVDLLLGPLDDPGRALVELRRMADRYPGSREAQAAGLAIPQVKERIRARGG